MQVHPALDKQETAEARATSRLANQVKSTVISAANTTQIQAMGLLIEQTTAAAVSSGEIALIQAIPPVAGLSDIRLGPVRRLNGGIKRFFLCFPAETISSAWG